jgi:SAM-dependent methyltransferase
MSKQTYTEEELRAIEQQLSCPAGAMGVEMGQRMNEFNRAMTDSSLELLAVEDQQRILELGHGNAGHLARLMARAQQLQYMGLDISATMNEQAQVVNQSLMTQHLIRFQLYDGTNLPFEEDSFDRIFTVNTIYFWEQPAHLMQEMARTLSPKGRLIVAFAHRSYLEQSPVIGKRFNLIDKETIQQLAAQAGLTKVGFEDRTDQIEDTAGVWVERPYIVAVLQK